MSPSTTAHSGGGPQDDLLVSACMIVKDESETLPDCIASMKGFVDEIVIYDTGSTDGTVELAKSLGCRVIEGYWDDDFSRARNASLEHCSGHWILWIDADERLVTDDISGMRDLVRNLDDRLDALQVSIDNLSDGVRSNFAHSALRMFRRVRCRWNGRLHEQIDRLDSSDGMTGKYVPEIRIIHLGYTGEMQQTQDKVERNLRLARDDLEQSGVGADKGLLLFNLGRALLVAGGRDAEAAERLREAIDITPNPITKRHAYRMLIKTLIDMADYDIAQSAIVELRAQCTTPVLPDLLQGDLSLARGDYLEALDSYGKIDLDQHDDDEFEYGPAITAGARSKALTGLGKPGDAADLLLQTFSDTGFLDVPLENLISNLHDAGRSAGEISQIMPVERTMWVLAQALRLAAWQADELLEPAYCRFDGTPEVITVLAPITVIVASLPSDRACVWNSRLEQHGLSAGGAQNMPHYLP